MSDRPATSSESPTAIAVPIAAGSLRTDAVPTRDLPPPTPLTPRRRRPLRQRIADLLALLSPASPIFLKEVAIAGRKFGTYSTRCIYVLLILTALVIAYIAARSNLEDHRSTGVAAIQSLQNLAPILTMVVAWLQFICLGLLAPLSTAASFCDERRSGTLSTLLTTPLTAFQIVLGKLIASLSQLVILAALAIPVLLAIRVYGGVEAKTIGEMTALALAVAIEGAAIGLFFSTRCKKSNTAAALALITFLLIQVGPGIILAIVESVIEAQQRAATDQATQAQLSQLAHQAIEITLPIMSGMVMFALTATSFGPMPFFTMDLDLVVPICISANLGIGLIFFSFAVRSARRAMWADAEGKLETPRPKRRRGRAPIASELPPFADVPSSDSDVPAPESESGLPKFKHRHRTVRRVTGDLDVGDHPVLWREVRQTFFSTNLRLYIWTLVLAVIVVPLYVYNWEGNKHHIHAIVMMFGFTLAVIVAAVTSTGGITNERDARTLDTLLVSPLSAWDIVLGKFCGAMRRQWYFPAIVIGQSLLFGVLPLVFSPLLILHEVLMIGGSIAVTVAAGNLMSVLVKRTASSTAAGLGCAILMWGVPPILWVGVVGYFLDWPVNLAWYHNIQALLNATNPFFMLGIADEGALMRPHRESYMTPGYDLDSLGHYGAVSFTFVVMAVAAIYTMVTYGILRLAAHLLGLQSQRRR